jgi:hypothetical protein
LSQPFETQPIRTGYPIAAGVMIIVSACLLAVSNFLLYLSYPSNIILSEWPNLAVSIILDVLAILGGVLALAKTRFVFAVFGTSILIPSSLSSVTFILSALARSLTGTENLTISLFAVLFIAISPIVLVLSVLSLVFLAMSRNEFN